MNDNSDYNKPYQNLFNLLPEPNQSETNHTLFHNLFNRFLTKDETEQIAGYIGKGNFDALQRRQIREFNVHRQANQLQPILYNKIGSVEWMSSWKDLLNKAERLGIDNERIPEWLNLQQFNWVPPVDIDKIINYRNYYWYDPENPTSSPQYITIRSRCQVAIAFANFIQQLVDLYGETIPIVGIDSVDAGVPVHSINSTSSQQIQVDGDTSTLQFNDYFYVEGTGTDDGRYQVSSTPSYDPINEITTVQVYQTFSNQNTVGQIKLQRFDKLIVEGDVRQLLDPGFVFFVADSSNEQLNDTFFTVVDTELFNGNTLVQIDSTFTKDTFGNAVVSLAEKLQGAIADRDCLCSGTIGWDILQWDDNPDEPLWDGDHDSLINSISNSTAPTSPGTNGQLWWDQSSDQLYQYSTENGWVVLWNSFSKLVNDTAGQAFWDLTPSCGITNTVSAANQWIDQNKWLHKSDVPSFSIAKQAQLPILEYDWDLELNEWMFTEYNWKYRVDGFNSFKQTDKKPNLIELIPIALWELDTSGSNDTLIFDERYGDLTDVFVPDFEFLGVNQADIITVVSSRYVASSQDGALRTQVEVQQDIQTTDLVPGDLVTVQSSPTPIRPLLTSNGDPWVDYDVHWLFDGQQNNVPTVHQPENPQMAIDPVNDPLIYDSLLDANIRYTNYAEQFVVLSTTPGDTYELTAPSYNIAGTSITSTSGAIFVNRDQTDQFNPNSLVFIRNSTNNDGSYVIQSASYNVNNNQTRIELVDGQFLDSSADGVILPVDNDSYRRLRHRALLGFNDARVYINDVRQYGNYDELEDVVVPVSQINEITPTTTPRTFSIVVDTDLSNSLSAGDVIRYEQDSNIASASYSIISIGTSDIVVEESDFADLSNSTGDGVLYGVTSPITDVSKGISYVRGIQFFPSVNIDRYDEITIEVGEAAITDIGFASVPVRMIEDDSIFSMQGTEQISLINFRKNEQTKTKINQYPLFDIYRIDGSPANKANHIFGYQTDSEQDVNALIGQRIVQDSVLNDYGFEQLLLDGDAMLAYRDYSNQQSQYWYDPDENILYQWTGLTWSSKVRMGDFFEEITISKNKPSQPYQEQLWFNSLTNELSEFDGTTWNTINATINITNTDPTLQTIWKSGLNDDQYQPVKIDWNMRSEDEYDRQQNAFVEERVTELLIANSSLTQSEAESQAVQEWLDEQKKGAQELSPTGQFVGDWEIPDPLYFNHMHENRKNVSFRELLTHFSSIISSQEKIPGYVGRDSDMFRMIPSDEVNYAVGGRIKEFNHSFDTFLSALFVNNITPISLFEFADQQYQSQLNTIQEQLRTDLVDILTSTDVESLQDLTSFIADNIITSYEQNDFQAQVYGDTTAFTDNISEPDTGIRNWIATLPHLNVVNKKQPTKLIDTKRDISQIVHHDGHRNTYQFEPAVIQSIVSIVVNTEDPRTNGMDTFGRISNDSPPNDMFEFQTSFNTSISNREGVYWSHDGTLYRLNIVNAGSDEPTSSLPDDTLWFDTTIGQEVLRVKQTDQNTGTVQWPPVNGLSLGDGKLHNGTDPSDIATSTVSAWSPVNINDTLTDTILLIEEQLYQNVSDDQRLVYDFEQLFEQYEQLFLQLEEQQFLEYVNQYQIEQPFSNDQFTLSDPFTWNYKRSTISNGYDIVQVDPNNDSFIVRGDQVSVFDPCTANGSCPSQTSFFVKNTGTNDGEWMTLTSTSSSPTAVYDSSTNNTTVYVDGNVEESFGGVIYKGLLPSSDNTGGESGGYWEDLYQKFYNTPYPHLEPWKLQGYSERPLWWNQEYSNDDSDRWGDRRWKYKHGFEINGGDTNEETFTIDGDFVQLFTTNSTFSVDRSTNHDGQWKVGSIASIVSATTGSNGSATVEVGGDITNIIQTGYKLAVVDSSYQLIQTLTVIGASFQGPPNNNTVISVEETVTSTVDFDLVSGSFYDPSANLTTIYIDTTATVPNLTDVISPVDGRIVKPYGMWENIRIGQIPAGRPYPNGVISITGVPSFDRTNHGITVDQLPTYNYFSVNIDNDDVSSDGGTTKYSPDDVLPPFWNFVSHFGTAVPPSFDRRIRSLFSDFSTEIDNPSAEYSFRDAGPIEWEWRTSISYGYDRMAIAFQIDPVRVLSSIFGTRYQTIDDLNINKDTEQVFGHNRTVFHGEVVDDQPYVSNGINQWYVNYNRFIGLDASYADFRTLWTDWTAPMMYQFSSFLDVQSLQLSHRDICVNEFDYNITAKKSAGVEDHRIDSFDVTVMNIPPTISRFNNQHDWRFELRTQSTVNQPVSYYDVHNYQFYADTNTNVCTIYTYQIKHVDITNKIITINNDQTTIMAPGREVEITDSTANDGTYEIVSSVFDPVANQTLISFDTLDLNDTTADGLITANYRSIPWETGDTVIFSSDETLPSPLEGDNRNGVSFYYIIRIDQRSFKVARTRSDAAIGNAIDINTQGRRNSYVGQLNNTFIAQGGNTPVLWKHFAVDTTSEIQMMLPTQVQGIQQLINIIDGYQQFKESQGWEINHDNSLRDFDNPSRIVSWQVELERFIDFIFGLRRVRTSVPDRYQASVDSTTNVWTFTENSSSQLITGDQVNVYSTNNIYPTPITRGTRYYMIRDSLDQFRLAATKNDAKAGNEINITSTTGVDTLFVAPISQINKNRPTFELNPFRNGIWFSPERGIVSNTVTGPNEDARDTQTIFDQYSRPIDSSYINVYRFDQLTEITIPSEITNDVEPSVITNDPYNFIHLGGAHLFLDTYEHVLKLNNYTTDGQLLYDPFVGLNVTKYELQYFRQPDFTQRPNVGGHYLLTDFNQGGDIKKNFEANIEGLRHMYDTYTVSENSLLTQSAREAVGFETDSLDYFNDINVGDKSKFIFWRGMIQQKGSNNAINAFINSRRFIDAKVDEFWAFKLAEFGSDGEKEYPEIMLNVRDSRSDQLKLSFITSTSEQQLCNPGFGVDPYASSNCGYAFPNSGDAVTSLSSDYETLQIDNQNRWYQQPRQKQILADNGGNFYFNTTVNGVININTSTVPSLPEEGDAWIRNVSGTEHVFERYQDSQIVEHGRWDANITTPILRHDFDSDGVIVTLRWQTPGHTTNHTVPSTFDIVSTTASGNGNGQITVSGDQTKWFEQGDQVIITSTSAVGTYTITSSPSLIGNDTVLVVDYVTGSGNGGINSNVSGTGILEKDGGIRSLTIDNYLPLTSSLTVFVDGEQIVQGQDFTETFQGTTLTSNTILFNQDVAGKEVTVVYGISTLVNQVHFEHINANIIRLLFDDLVDPQVTELQLWGLVVNEQAHNPAKIVDVESDVVITPVQIWDPARGHHYSNAVHVVDLFNDNDPAIYTNTSNDTQPSFGAWNNQQAGTTWLDTSALDYKPYYDPAVYPDITNRTKRWGELADWANIAIYTWVQSDVPPQDWNELAQVEEVDNSIPQQQRKSGRVEQTLFEQINGQWVLATDKVDTFDAAIEGNSLGGGTYTFVVDNIPVITTTVVSVDTNENTITLDGNFEFTLDAGMTIVINENGTETSYQIEQIDHDNDTIVTISDNVSITSSSGQGVAFIKNSDVYINGSLRQRNASIVPINGTISSDTEVQFNNIENIDRITIRQPIPSDQEQIDSMVEQQMLLQEYQYTQVSTIDNIGNEQNTYYFWVRDKLTRGDRIMSPRIAEQNFRIIPTPFMFTQQLTPAQMLINDNGVSIELPDRYTGVIFRGLKGIIDDDQRYILRFTNDFTLRDQYATNDNPESLVTLHNEWELIRESQQVNIPRYLWDHITESIVGFRLDDSSKRVPSLERELYDQKFNQDTQYGLGTDQAFCDGSLALDIILRDLRNGENDFSPVDINVFFQNNDFTTDQGIIDAMTQIYTTFAFEHINRMFFSVLHDAALNKKAKYPGILKTSMLSLHGIRPFQQQGAFDD